ncbi:putative carboxypeptidase [Planctomycetales bacterium 10988]|nr:putative carboxypeptidase [Planctomycetales bacterium 10988]
MFFQNKMWTLIAVGCLLGMSGFTAQQKLSAEETPAYRPIGAPMNPKVEVSWNHFYNYEEATQILKKLAEAHPERMKLTTLGKSYGEREMWLATVTNFQEGKADQKPAFYIDGGIHANEIQTVEVVLYTIWYLCEAEEDSPFLQTLLKERTFYCVPMMSPDSRAEHFNQPNTTHGPRTGQRPVDDDRDGLVDEDGYDDLNNDGHITQMRVKDPHGNYKTHPDYPQILIRKKPEEEGEYRLLGYEGIDNDGDGKVNEDGDGYYDPNRDWAWQWQPSYIQRGAGHYPFSILENRYVADFVSEHPNIAGAQSYHNTAGMILRGPGAEGDSYARSDIAVYDKLGKQGERILPGYKYLNVAEGLYTVFGGEFDWFHSMRGIFSFTNELFTPFNYFREDQGGGFFGDQETHAEVDKYLLFGKGFIPWKEVDHPTYGKVEVGGMKKSWGRQPPSFLLEEECHRNMAFTLYHADQMPQVRIVSSEVETLSEGLYQLTVIVKNEKLIPTHSATDLKNKITPPDLLVLEGKEIEVLTAMSADEPFFERPDVQDRHPEKLRISNIPGNSVRYARWLLTGKGPLTIRLESKKGGSDITEVSNLGEK